MMNPNQLALPTISNDVNKNLSNSFSDRKQVVRLYFFSPRNIPDVCKRPHVYNFGMDFINDLEENISELGNMGMSGNIVKMSYMDKYKSSLDAIMPSSNGLVIPTHQLSHYWTFVLQIDNDQFRGQDGQNVFGGPILTNRYIYSGFCTDEPYSKNNGISIVYNPKCFLRITHVTSLANENRFRPSGGTVKKMVVSSDVDFIPPVTMLQLNNDANYYLSPQAVNQACVISDNDSNIYISNNKNLNNLNDKPISSSTLLNSPKHHLQTIVNAFMSSYDERNVDTVVSNGMYGNRLSSDINVFKTNISNKLNIGYTDDLLSIDPNKVYSIEELFSIYPMLQCVPVGADKLTNDSLLDQSVPSRTNIAHSIVSTSIPMFMSQAGLSELGFRYDSYVPTSTIRIGNEPSDGFKVTNYASWVLEDAHVVQMRIAAVLRMVREQLAPMLKNIGGEFSLSVSCCNAGECNAILIFYDDAVSEAGIYQTPLILGGINSPLIGSYNHLSHNGAYMSTLMTAMSNKFDNSFETSQMNYPMQYNKWSSDDFSTNVSTSDLFGNLKF